MGIRTLAGFGVTGERREGRVGIWVANARGAGEAKIAAIGVRVRRWVTYHGIAINIDPDLDHYRGIVPCGIDPEISGHGVTSLAALGIAATMADVDAALRASFDHVSTCRARFYPAQPACGGEGGVRGAVAPSSGEAHLALPVPAGRARGLAADAATGPLLSPDGRRGRPLLWSPG